MGTRPGIPGLISHTDVCVWSAATTAVVVSAVVFQPHGGLWRAHAEELGGREGMEGGWRGGNVSVFQAHTQRKAAAVPWERRPAGQPLFTDAEHASSCHLASQSLNTPPPPARRRCPLHSTNTNPSHCFVLACQLLFLKTQRHTLKISPWRKMTSDWPAERAGL